MKIFFDENFSKYLVAGISKFQEGSKQENIKVFHIEKVFGKGAKDEEWIPKIAKAHGILITQDKKIYKLRSLRKLCIECKLGVFFFHSPKNTPYTYWEWIRLTVQKWEFFKNCSKNTRRPFAFEINPRSKKPKLLS